MEKTENLVDTVKPNLQNNCTATYTISYRIMSLIKENICNPEDLCKSLKIPKQNCNYWLQKLKKDGLIKNYSKGIYDLTESGKKSLAGYNDLRSRQLIRLENMRYKCMIYKGWEKIIEFVRDPKKTKLNKTIQYTGKIGKLSVRVFVSEKNQSLEITCEKWLGENRYEIMYDARRQVEKQLEGFMKDPEIKLGMLEQSMKPEWAIPHELASIALGYTESSQIRAKGGLINCSKGRNPDLEVDDIVKAGKILNMPNELDEIKNMVQSIYSTMRTVGASNALTFF